MDCIGKSNPLPTANPRLIPLSYSGVIRVKMFGLKPWVFFKDNWNFNKLKSIIIDEKYYMLWKAMLGETIILLP